MLKRSALFGLVKHARYSVTAVVAATILYTQSPHVLWCTAGGLSCSLLARVLKGIIKQPRPAVVTEIEEEQRDGKWVETNISEHIQGSAAAATAAAASSSVLSSPNKRHHGKRRVIKKVFASSIHGMPSSHTQTTTFFATYFYTALGYRWYAGEEHQHTTLLAVLCVFVNVFCLTTAWSRVHLNRHTPAQVCVGWCIGTVYAAMWFVLWQFYGVGQFGNSLFRSLGL
ncbi:hypothetical protein HDU87_001441 [Geranomyces variabilis]|uniref:Phosphatidic acid phosphatase type 2/haloperoxidase domain-containing protein n=1 Tax=Geranomyces variabilis TaxID=109894 RepID=A0AAD5TB69_9FUNG|nr:hypothetical protein HDU87_001441 [Geranomyces variabilis]